MRSFFGIIISTLLVHQIVAFSISETCAKESEICTKKPNIACENIQLCSGAQVLTLSEAEKQQIVDAHNKHRNEIANGEHGFPAAAKMATIDWDPELAAMAELNVRRCLFKHDVCRNTDTYRYSGQNIATSYGNALAKFDRATVASSLVPFVDSWFGEYKDCQVEIIRAYSSSPDPNIQWGHFTVMVADRNVKLGCAVVWYPEGNIGRINFACNYATTNMNKFPIYAEGPAASNCKTGANPQYNGLCSNQEQYVINDFFQMYPDVQL